MLFGLSIGAIFIIFMVIEFVINKRPMLFILTAFSLFYWNLRGWMLFSGLYVKYAYLNDNASITEVNHAWLPYFIISICLAVVYFGYRVFYSNTKGDCGFNESDLSSIDVIVGWIVVLLISPIYLNVILIYGIFSFIYFYIKECGVTRVLNLIPSVFFLVIYFLYITDDRRDFLAALLVPIFLFMYYNKFRVKIALVVVPVVLFAITYTSIVLRSNSDSLDIIFSEKDVFIKIIEVETDFSIVYDDLVFLLKKLTSGEAQYLSGLTLMKPLFYFIPRSIFPDKPESLSIIYSQTFNSAFAASGGSQPVTIIGDLFWNLSYFSMVPLFFFGGFLGWIDKCFSSHREKILSMAIVGVSFSIVFSILRGPLDNFAISFIFIFFGIKFIHSKKIILTKNK